MVYMSSDNGNSWMTIGEIGDLGNNNIYGLLVDHNKNIFVYTGDIFRKKNGESSWEKISSGYSFNHTPNKYSLDCVITQNNVVYLSSNGEGVYFSDDTFETWNLINSGLSSTNCASLVIDYLNGYLYVGCKDWLSKSIYPVNPPVPVELISFTSNKMDDVIELRWLTATETNNNGFEIERKADTNSWSIIGFVKGRGTTSEKTDYSFIDNISQLNADSIAYRLKQIDFDGNYSYSREVHIKNSVPIKFILEQNYPNPFNPSTKIKFEIPKQTNVKLVVYDVLGNEAAVLVNKELNTGSYEYVWDASYFPSGVYFYRIEAMPTGKQAEGFVKSAKMILMK